MARVRPFFVFMAAVLIGWVSVGCAHAQWIGPSNDGGVVFGGSRGLEEGTLHGGGVADDGETPARSRTRRPGRRPAFGCMTNMSFSSGHGTQVTFLRPDGTVFLWYPGNTVVLPGRWRLAPQADAICFLYHTTTRNPVTGRPGDQWACIPMGAYRARAVDQASGDVFGLAGRSAVPFVLPRERTTIARLRERVQAAGAARAGASCG